jgi:hypothetical protein
MQNCFSLLALDQQDEVASTSYRRLSTTKHDVWDVRPAADDPRVFAIMDKTKLTIMRELDAEAPIVTRHYLISFGDLEAAMVDLDALMADPEVHILPA